MDFENAFRIRATASSAESRIFVLKEGELFALFDRFGDIQSVGVGSQGVYLGGTRHLSRLALLLEGAPPLLLSSTVRADNVAMAVDLTNPDLDGALGDSLRADTLHIRRVKLLLDGTYWEELTLRNHARGPLDAEMSILFDCDYADIFEVRGTLRPERGVLDPPVVAADTVVRKYRGLDDGVRQTTFRFIPNPTTLTGHRATFRLHLEPKATLRVWLSVLCEAKSEITTPEVRVLSFGEAVQRVTRQIESTARCCAHITTSNHLLNDWLSRSFTDLHMLTTQTPHGPYPYAGIPWFSAAFGRDGLITARECMWLNPHLSGGVLRYLANNQATELDPERDAQPGKILHESRLGEMANLGEIPFGRYYGSIDATPLFVHLLARHFVCTGDLDIVKELWPSVQSALQWIEEYGDTDADGYVEYARASETGLVHQGWKDSGDAVFHASGRAASAPIALCEVQGYVYAAFEGASLLATALGQTADAARLAARALRLKEAFDRDFWSDELGCYALALDGHKRPCLVRTSNAGQCLWTGIVQEKRVEALTRVLMSDSLYSGWGVRTLANNETLYNPLAYHNGSVWPHDTALIALGLSQYGRKREAARIFEGLFAAASHFDLQRLPEVFCGFKRRPHEAPVRYPVACLPQAWAAGAVYLLLEAVLGLAIDGAKGTITLHRPVLPEFLDRIELRDLRCGPALVNLRLVRHTEDVGVEVTERRGPVVVTVNK